MVEHNVSIDTVQRVILDRRRRSSVFQIDRFPSSSEIGRATTSTATLYRRVDSYEAVNDII
jgi:hypothetical protein